MPLGVPHILEVDFVRLRDDPGLKRVPGSVGAEGEKGFILRDNPFARPKFILHDLIIDARSATLLVEGLGGAEFVHDPSGNDGGGDQLAVGMGKRGPRLGPMVLEDQDILEPGIVRQVNVAVPIGADDFVDFLRIQGRQVLGMIRGLDDYLMSANPTDGLKDL